MAAAWLHKILTYHPEDAINQFQYLNTALACFGVFLFFSTQKSEIQNLAGWAVLFIILNFTIYTMFNDASPIASDDLLLLSSSTFPPALYHIMTISQLMLCFTASSFLIFSYYLKRQNNN